MEHPIGPPATAGFVGFVVSYADLDACGPYRLQTGVAYVRPALEEAI
jgi:hypothetical protein